MENKKIHIRILEGQQIDIVSKEIGYSKYKENNEWFEEYDLGKWEKTDKKEEIVSKLKKITNFIADLKEYF